jgi:DNA-binding PadR family transcriptional regulator
MNQEKIKKMYAPMSETAFLILLSLEQERHGYGITQYIKEKNEQVVIGPGTMYGTLSKFEKDGLIT